jgi:DNA repair protein RecO (recombination protein O)
MPLYRAEALILRTYRLAEADLIVVFLTRDRGKKRGVAKHALRSRRRFMGALEPMTRGKVAYFEREHRELVRLDAVEPARSPWAVARDGDAGGGDALAHIGYFAELLDEWTPEADPNETLFRLGASMVDALAAGAPVGPLARYFEYWLLRLQGVYPSIVGCGACGRTLDAGAVVLPREREFVCRECVPTRADAAGTVSPAALAFLRGAASTPPQQVAALGLDADPARELEVAHGRLIATHLEKELKSARVLRELR